MKLSIKAKNGLLIAGTALICVGAMVAVLNMSSKAAVAEPASSASSSPSTSTVVSVPPIEQQFEAESGTSSAFVPESGASQTAELTKIEKPVSAPPAPSVASGTNLTDKSKKPSYSSSAPAKSSSNTPAKKAPSKKPSTNPGDNDPVFGNQKGTGGAGTVVEGDWGGGSQVGIMN